MGKFWWWPFGRVPEVAAQELYALIQNRKTTPVILDVRTVGEWSDGRIAGSINVPVTELKHRLPGLALDRSRPIVAVCRSAHRSIPAVRLLQQQGFSQVCQLQGGMRSWWRAELAVEGAKVADTGK
jgi:rhodanese-related sulfurtransferase